MTSLPLLLIDALAATGSLDDLVPVGDTLASVVKRGRVYILINALVGNLTRFASGPCSSSHPLALFSSRSDFTRPQTS